MQGPSPLTNAQVQIAVKPVLGGEMRIYVTRDTALELAVVQIAATNSGVNSDNSPYTYNQTQLAAGVNLQNAALPPYPCDLIIVGENVITDVGPITITINGLDEAGAPQTGTAILEVPNYASVTDQIFEPGWAADVVPAGGAAKQWSAILSWTISCTAAAVYGKFSIWAMPNLSRYTLIANTQEKSIRSLGQQPLAISSGLREGAYIKPGIIPVGTMRLGQRWVSYNDGLARFDGSGNLTVRVDVLKEQKVLDCRFFMMIAALSVNSSAGDGAAVGELAVDVMYQDLAIMLAMGPGQPAE